MTHPNLYVPWHLTSIPSKVNGNRVIAFKCHNISCKTIRNDACSVSMCQRRILFRFLRSQNLRGLPPHPTGFLFFTRYVLGYTFPTQKGHRLNCIRKAHQWYWKLVLSQHLSLIYHRLQHPTSKDGLCQCNQRPSSTTFILLETWCSSKRLLKTLKTSDRKFQFCHPGCALNNPIFFPLKQLLGAASPSCLRWRCASPTATLWQVLQLHRRPTRTRPLFTTMPLRSMTQPGL